MCLAAFSPAGRRDLSGRSGAAAPPKILFEDNHLIAVEKPPGVLSQRDASGAPDLLTIIKAHIKARDRKPGAVFLGLVHRLDRNVGGAMVFAKTSKAAARLSAQIRERTFEKFYCAVVAGRPSPPSGRLEHLLVKNARENLVRAAPVTNADTLGSARESRAAAAAGGRRAVLEYETLGTKGSMTLLRVRLVTGRAHQIRAQLAAIGTPIAGDEKYGAPRALSARRSILRDAAPLALWSARLVFRHPTRDEKVVIESAPPTHGAWGSFAHLL